MKCLDPRLNHLRQQPPSDLAQAEAGGRYSLDLSAPNPTVRVMILFDGNTTALADVGFEVTSVAGDVVSGRIPVADLERLGKLPNVRLVESSRKLSNELDISLGETRADLLHNAAPPTRGGGVLIGVIDTGIDYTHESFMRLDCGEEKQTRVVAIWNQKLKPDVAGGERSPSPYGYGVEYTAAQINAALGSDAPLTIAPSGFASRRTRHACRVHR